MIGEIIINGCISLVMLILFVVSFSFPYIDIAGSMGAGGWPRGIIVMAMLLNIILMIQLIYKKRNGKEISEKVTLKEIQSFAYSTVIFVIFIFLLSFIGFFWSAPFLIIAFMLQLGVRKVKSLVLTPLISTVSFTLLFGRIMEVSLPRGVGIFRVLTYYMY